MFVDRSRSAEEMPSASKKNRPDLEPDICKKGPMLEEAFKRDSKSLENDYNASLRELQRK